MVRRYRIGFIKGDGIGPEIMDVALDIINEFLNNVELVELKAGYEFYRKYGRPFEEGLIDKIRKLDAVIKGPLTTLPGPKGYRSINVYLRQALGLYANVRPFTSYRGISRDEFNFVIIRENTEGLYSGVEGRFKDLAFTLRIITKEASRRICEFAFKYAIDGGYKLVTAVHKANILKESDGLFREVFFEVSQRYEGVKAEEMFVDAAAYNLIKNPKRFQVIVTPNLYGDILSDEAAGLVGSLGLCGSAQIGDDIAIFEPVHGSAPDIAGKGIANPIGQLTALSLMTNYLGRRFNDSKMIAFSKKLSKAIRYVVEESKVLTPDLGGNSSTKEVSDEIKRKLQELL
mgnify:CR=1 FL=1